MRCTQLIGLPKNAIKFLNKNVELIPNVCCPNCKTIINTKWNAKIYASAKDEGMFDDGPDLLEYTLIDGKIIREKVQAAPWSSGPCIFLMLVDESEKILYKWTDKEIEKNI
jgi:hypothetical protein